MIQIDQRFGDLVVVAKGKKPRTWLCYCVCGKYCTPRERALVSNLTRSCGCAMSKWNNITKRNSDYLLRKAIRRGLL